MLFIRLFRRAGTTGHVFFLKNGATEDKGLAYSGFIGPKTAVAVVPTTSQILDFSVETRTADKQAVTVTGNLKVALSPAEAVAKFDFTVNTADGAYLSPWEQMLRAVVIEHVLAPIHETAKTLTVEAAMSAHARFETAITAALSAATVLAQKGISIESCSTMKIEPRDNEVTASIGSKERQAMLTASDLALHTRRLKASDNDRAVKTFESQTALKLEEERAKLVAQQSENKQQEAEADAKATKTRLSALEGASGGKVLGAAIMKMAETGRVGNLSIVPELLTALNSGNGTGK